MGKKPLMGLAGLCLAGLIVCGCEDNKQYGGSRRAGPAGSPGGHSVPPPPSAMGGGATAGSGWNATPAQSLTSRPGSSTDLGGTTGGMGLGSSTTPGGSGLGSSGLGSGTKPPAGALPGATGSGPTDPASLGGSTSGAGLGSQQSPLGMPSGMTGGSHGLSQTSNLPSAAGNTRLADAPPATGGMPSAGGMGASATGSTNNLLAPPPPPPAMGRGAGSLNLGDSGMATPPSGMNPSPVTGSSRTTVQPDLGGSPLPSPPPVPTVNNNSLQ